VVVERDEFEKTASKEPGRGPPRDKEGEKHWTSFHLRLEIYARREVRNGVWHQKR